MTDKELDLSMEMIKMEPDHEQEKIANDSIIRDADLLASKSLKILRDKLNKDHSKDLLEAYKTLIDMREKLRFYLYGRLD